MYGYTPEGRTPFDPERLGATLGGCVLCGDPALRTVGVFLPQTEETYRAVLALRQHPVPPGSDVGLAYGLCAAHDAVPGIAGDVEARIVALAKRVRVQ